MTQAFNLSQLGNNINSSGQVSLTAGVTGTLPIANGGTNATATPTLGGVIVGTGTAYSSTAAGTSGYFLQSNGSAAPTWAIAGGGLGGTTVFTSSGTFTIPAGKTVVKVTIVGSGGGSGPWGGIGYSGGGGGGSAIKYLTGLTPGNTLTVTVGAAGTAGGSGSSGTGGTGGSSSVASGTQTITTLTATGGAGGTTTAGGPSGNITVFINGGAGGTSSSGDFNMTGGTGAPCAVSGIIISGCNTPMFAIGVGGGTLLGTAAPNGYFVFSNYSTLTQGTGYGVGGYAATYNSASVAGLKGIVIFEY